MTRERGRHINELLRRVETEIEHSTKSGERSPLIDRYMSNILEILYHDYDIEEIYPSLEQRLVRRFGREEYEENYSVWELEGYRNKNLAFEPVVVSPVPPNRGASSLE